MVHPFFRTDFFRAIMALVVLFAALHLVTPANAQNRHALVVGIDNYDAVTKLEKAINDANAVGERLRSAGFETKVVIDPTGNTMVSELEQLAMRIQPGDEVVFFFAGHGVELQGQNYLLPADVSLEIGSGPLFVRRQSLPVAEITNAFQARGARVSLLILDACRDNPFGSGFTRSAGGTRGLARMSAPEGTYIMYSAGAGQKALDSLGPTDADPNSVFTRTLLPRLSKPGGRLRDTALEVRSAVRKMANSVGHNQFPAIYDQLDGEFLFLPAAMPTQEVAQTPVVVAPVTPVTPVPVAPAVVATPPLEMAQDCEKATADWVELRKSGSVPSIRDFAKGIENQCQDPKMIASVLAHLEERKSAMKTSCVALSEKLTSTADFSPANHERFERDVAAARRVCEGMAQDFPDDPEVENLVSEYLVQVGKAYEIRMIDDPNMDRYQIALRGFKTAADAGSSAAMRNIALLYRNGEGVEQDYVAAMRGFEAAANAGNAAAVTNIGWLYHNGHGVEQDHGIAMQWYQKAVASGDAAAMRNMGLLYRNGHGVEQNFTEAMRWYQKAAQGGNVPAINNIGMMYRNGDGVEQDYDAAMRWFHKAADAGNVAAINNIGLLYRFGYGVEQDYIEAMYWHRKAADAGNASAINNIGLLYRNGYGVEQDFAQAMRWHKRAADAGSAEAVNNIGWLYHNGKGVEQDFEAAMHWYRQAAEAGSTDGMRNLGLLYRNGEGVEQDFDTAVMWYKQAAEDGDAAAMTNLAGMYHSGKGVDQDFAKAMRLYQMAAADDNPAAMRNIGLLHRDGKGVIQDHVEAMNWFRKSADAGNAAAMWNVGMLYRNGKGVNQDLVEAMHWFQKAATAGNVLAMRNVALLLRDGRGAEQDFEQSMHWFQKAAEAGNGPAMRNIGMLYQNGQGVEKDEAEAALWYARALQNGINTGQFVNWAKKNAGTNVIRELQLIMRIAGIYHGAVDGSFGPKTLTAIELYKAQAASEDI